MSLNLRSDKLDDGEILDRLVAIIDERNQLRTDLTAATARAGDARCIIARLTAHLRDPESMYACHDDDVEAIAEAERFLKDMMP